MTRSEILVNEMKGGFAVAETADAIDKVNDHVVDVSGFKRVILAFHLSAATLGDTITVKITESTSASTKSNNKVDKSNTQKASIGASAGMFSRVMPGAAEFSAGSSTAFSGKGEAANNNVFTGNMTVTVIDVLPNGNLLVSGEKQVAVGDEQEFVRISGVINPSFVDATNTVESSKIADARIEYKSSGQVAEAQTMGWLARFFLNVLPF